MTAHHLLQSLTLPADTRIDQRIAKKLLLERSRATAAQKRLLQESIDELLWVASLKPNTIGIAAYRDDVREYLEIAVLSVRLRPDSKVFRIAELIHRAIPYPTLLIAESPDGVELSLAHKRWSEAEHGETVAEDLHRAILTADDSAGSAAFRESLGLTALLRSTTPIPDMRALYQAWIDRVSAHNAFAVAGIYTVPTTPEDGVALRNALQAYAALSREMVALRAQAQKEVQVSRRVELNLAVKRIEAELATLRSTTLRRR
jgi:hypothetical protein